MFVFNRMLVHGVKLISKSCNYRLFYNHHIDHTNYCGFMNTVGEILPWSIGIKISTKIIAAMKNI